MRDHTASSPHKVLFYVQHLLGIGHVRRVILLAQATAAHGLDVVVVSGGFPTAALDSSGLRVIQLPPCKAANESFDGLIDKTGQLINDHWKTRRKDILLDAVAQEAPDMVVIEMFPFGRGMLKFELLPLLDALKSQAHPPQVVTSIRDILVHKSEKRQQQTVDILNRYFDAVLVHGDPDFVPLDETFPLLPHVSAEVVYTGYAAPPNTLELDGLSPSGEVIVSVGGSSAGIETLRCAIAARAHSQSFGDKTWRLLVPPTVAADVRQELETMAGKIGDGMIVENTRPDFPQLMAQASVSVSLSGYNTVMDILNTQTPAVLIPFVTETETEQQHRAEALERHGLAIHLPGATMTPQSLARAVDQAADAKPSITSIARDGAEASAQWILGALDPWAALDRELDAWHHAGQTARLWWRDDDAVQNTPELQQLLALSDKYQAPLCIATIPTRTDGSLKTAINGRQHIAIAPHGYAHVSHTTEGKKSEFRQRPIKDMAQELQSSLNTLRLLFGDTLCPVFVPPWNRIGPEAEALLPKLGYSAVSTFNDRTSAHPHSGLTVLNTHVDIINWPEQRASGDAFGGEHTILRTLTAALRRRRLGQTDPDEAIGLLTHHLVHDAACWTFLDDLLCQTAAHPAARWISVQEALT